MEIKALFIGAVSICRVGSTPFPKTQGVNSNIREEKQTGTSFLTTGSGVRNESKHRSLLGELVIPRAPPSAAVCRLRQAHLVPGPASLGGARVPAERRDPSARGRQSQQSSQKRFQLKSRSCRG